jgi:hypothetical protein
LQLPQRKALNLEVDAKLRDRAAADGGITENPEAATEDRNKYKKSRYDLHEVNK